MPTKHFIKHNRKAPLTKPLFDPDVSDETRDNDIKQTNTLVNEANLENNSSDSPIVVDHDALKIRRKRFSRKLTPTPDEMIVPSGSLIDSVASNLSKSGSSVFSEDDEKVHIADTYKLQLLLANCYPDKF